jgi:hypothetical protein
MNAQNTERKVVPIKASEAQGKLNKSIPDEVIEAFNELIIKNLSGGSATVHQDEVVRLIVKKGIKRADIFENHWLDVENLFQENGWEVDYDKPGYNESYEAYFVFEVKK